MKRFYRCFLWKIIIFVIVMTFYEIRQHLLSGDSVCRRYRSLLSSASSKDAIASIISDSNGVEFMTARISTDISMDYDEVASTLKAHVNGRRVFQHDGYTSEIYCAYKGHIDTRSTILAVWGSQVDIHIPAHHAVEINCDSHSSCTITADEGTRVTCVYWGQKPAVTAESTGSVKFVDKSKHQ